MSFCAQTPGLNREGAEFLAKHGAIMIGADNLTLEQTPSAHELNFFPIHTYLLAEAGIPIMEMAWLEELAQEQLYEFAFFGACIKLRGATGSPMRPVAMPLVLTSPEVSLWETPLCRSYALPSMSGAPSPTSVLWTKRPA